MIDRCRSRFNDDRPGSTHTKRVIRWHPQFNHYGAREGLRCLEVAITDDGRGQREGRPT